MQFNFGENWKNFSQNALQVENLEQARNDFLKLVEQLNLKDKTFIDIGFGQGLGLLNATLLGAKTLGCDINPTCNEVLKTNKLKFAQLHNIEIPIVIGSILEENTLNEIRNKNQFFDIVHSWGVLHHTGNMWKAIDLSIDLVADKGYFIIAIYNRHWSSFGWKIIKWFYNVSPKFMKWLLIKFFYVIIFVAKFLVTFKNPLKKERGMNFYYDVIDWLGGYPYEYATVDEIKNYFEKKGFENIKTIKAQVPTGCNEFIFRKI